MSQLKTRLQHAEEVFGLAEEFIEVYGLQHKCVGAGLEHVLLIFSIAADSDDGGFIRRVGFNAAANINAVDARNFDVQNQQVRFQPAHLKYTSDAIQRGCELITSFTFTVRLED